MHDHPVDRWSGWVPILMSLVAFVAVAKASVNFSQYGPPATEDGPWHLFMLMMVGQVPIIGYFVISCRNQLRRAAGTLATQLVLWTACMTAACCSLGMY